MVSNFIYKTLFVVIFFFTICYLFLYSLFYKTDVFADSLEGRIRESFKKHSDGFLVDYSSFDGNFDQGFTFNEIILKRDSTQIYIESLSFKLLYHKTLLSSINRLFNQKTNILDQVKLAFLSAKNFEFENKSFNFQVDEINLDQSAFSAKKITFSYTDNIIELDQLETLGFYDLSLNSINVNQFLNGENQANISRIDFSNKNYNNKYTYLDIISYPTYKTISSSKINLTSLKSEFYYNDIKYYFNYDFNVGLIYDSGKLLINSFKVFDDKMFNKIDLYGEIFYKNLKVNVDCNTHKQMFFNTFIPRKSNIIIKGQDYTYEVDFKFYKTKKFVKSTIDKISGKLKFNLNEDIDYLISFPQPVQMIDKDYEGSFSISDLYKFDDIYKVEIIVDTERINPFKLNHFKLSD